MWRRKQPYGSMKLEDIFKLPVERIAAEDAMLWLWTTNAHIHDALHVMEEWGFTYKTKRTWFKPKFGMGFWLRGQTEELLLGTRGAPTRGGAKRASAIEGHNIPTALIAPAGKHSAKPPESYRDIERLSKPPRIELFARRARKGWDSWGNEAKELDKELERDVDKYL